MTATSEVAKGTDLTGAANVRDLGRQPTTPQRLRAGIRAPAPAYLAADFAAIDAEHGSLNAYLTDALALTPATLDQTRRPLVLPASEATGVQPTNTKELP